MIAIGCKMGHTPRMVEETFTRIPVERPVSTLKQPQGRCLDKGGDEVRELLAKFGFTAHIRARGEEAHAITREAGDKARRWVVECTHRGMNRFRRLLVRGDTKGCNDLACLHLVCASTTYRRSDLWG
jgi:putative transposase